MNILIAGGTGFIGGALVSLLKQQHQVTVLTRDKLKKPQFINWQELQTVDGFDVVINLCGENIGAKRWSARRKEAIITSRIATTAKLAELCAQAKNPKPHLINASAIGVYGLQVASPNGLSPAYDETSVIDFASAPDYLAEVGRAWEQAAFPALNAGCDVTWMRFGVVLDRSGGALQKLLPVFKLGLGGKIGTGYQAFSWISRDDVVRAIQFIIENKLTGAVNCVAPHAVTQCEFAHILARVLQVPCFLPMPAWVVHLLFGQMGDELLLRGQHVKPLRLSQCGFAFNTPTIEAALREIVAPQ